MNRQEQIAKLDLEQAKANFDIETDPGRHWEPPTMTFNRLVICSKCRKSRINHNSHRVTITCPVVGMYSRDIRRAEYCDDNERVAEIMRKYYD
jgi:hypothetical protein